MLLTIFPLPIVATSIWPSKHAMSLFLIFNIVSLVLSSVGPCKQARSMHLVDDPCALVQPSIGPRVGTKPVDIILFEFTVVCASICPVEIAVSLLLSVIISPLVAGVVRPDFFALPMLFIFEPVTFVPGSIRMLVSTLSVRFVVLPLPVVNISIGMDQSPAAIGLFSSPVSFIHRAIYPHLYPPSVFLSVVGPFSFVASSIF